MCIWNLKSNASKPWIESNLPKWNENCIHQQIQKPLCSSSVKAWTPCGMLFGRGNIFCKRFSLSLKSTNTQWALCTNKQNKTLTIYALCCNESHRFIPVISLLFAISDLNVNLNLHSWSLFLEIRYTPFALIVKPNISAKYVANTSALLLMPNMFALLYVVQSIALLYNINWDTIVGF